eukprot:10904708-Alexandrium_andersonii.AAC.1
MCVCVCGCVCVCVCACVCLHARSSHPTANCEGHNKRAKLSRTAFACATVRGASVTSSRGHQVAMAMA